MLELIVSLILQLTGITREVNPNLVAIAEQRAIEIQTNFSHDGMQTPEILAYNSQPTEELAIQRAIVQWNESAPHHAIMFNSSYNHIGCATSHANNLWYIVCTFNTAPQRIMASPAPEEPQPTTPQPAAPLASEPPAMLPDTSMGVPWYAKFWLYLRSPLPE